MKAWRKCCPYREGMVVEHNGREWVSLRRTGRGEEPGQSGAWEFVGAVERAVELAGMVDPRIGEGM